MSVLPIAQASVLRWVLMGGISANQVFWHGLLVVVSWREYGGPLFALLCVGGLLGKRSGVLVAGLCLAHCWVLRQQGLFAAMQGILGVSCCSCGRHPLVFVWGGCG